jgi:hypothetical protein
LQYWKMNEGGEEEEKHAVKVEVHKVEEKK